MRQRGRKSAASLETINVDGSPDRLQPPDHLSADERQRFTDIVANCDARHFRPSDVTLLVRFVEADALAERSAKELRKNPVIDGKPSPYSHSGKIRAHTDGAFHAVAFIAAKPDRCTWFGPTGTASNREPMGMVT